MWLKTEASVLPASSVEPGHQMLGADEEKESNVTLRKERKSLIKIVITYFHKIIRIHKCGDKHLPLRTTALVGRRWMDGEETEDRTVKVSPESVRVQYPGGQARVKPRPVPPPQGPGGRCRGTDERGPSSSDA